MSTLEQRQGAQIADPDIWVPRPVLPFTKDWPNVSFRMWPPSHPVHLATRENWDKWLDTKPDTETYSYLDCSGRCAFGQFMASIGIHWDSNLYQPLSRNVLGQYAGFILSGGFRNPKCNIPFGHLKHMSRDYTGPMVTM